LDLSSSAAFKAWQVTALYQDCSKSVGYNIIIYSGFMQPLRRTQASVLIVVI